MQDGERVGLLPVGSEMLRWSVAMAVAWMAGTSALVAEAQSPPVVNGQPTYCLTPGTDGVCIVGGSWATANGVYSVTGNPKIRFAGGLEFALAPGSAALSVGTTPETASVNATAGLGYAGAGPLAGVGIQAGSVTLRFGRGRNLRGQRSFQLGSSAVRVQPDLIYFYAAFDGTAQVQIPGMSAAVPLPLPTAGLSSAILVGFDPANPGSVIFYLGGGFTSLMTQGIVADGAVLFTLSTTPNAPMATTDLGAFRTAFTGNAEVQRRITPNFQAEGTLSLFQGDDDADGDGSSSSSSNGTTSQQRQSPPPDGKPVPLTIAGMLAYDFDGNDDGITAFVQGFRDMRYGGRTSVTLDDVGLGQSLSLGTGTFYVNPGDGNCGATGEMLLRVDSVSKSLLADTPLAFLDPGTAGYRFDARVCGRDTMVRLQAGTVTAGSMPLGNVAVGFGFGGVDMSATLRMLGSDYRLRGSVDRNVVRLSSNGNLSIAGQPLASGNIGVVLRPTSVAGRVRGYVTWQGHRFELDQAFTTPPVDRLETGDIDVSQRISLDRVGTDALGASASITLNASARAFVSGSGWGMRVGGGVDYDVSTWGPAGRDSSSGSWDASFNVGSNGISTTLPGLSVNVAGTRLQVIPSGNQRFSSPDFDEPREQPADLIVAPSVAQPLALASNLRAATGAVLAPRVVRQDVIVTLEGAVEKTSGTLGVIGRLPRGLRPTNTLTFAATTWPRTAGSSGATITIRPSGEIAVATPNAATQGLSLDGISFSLRPSDGVAPGFGDGVVAAGPDVEAPVVIARGAFLRLQGTVRRASGNGPWTQIIRLPTAMRGTGKTLTFELTSSAGAVRANITDDGWLTYKSGPERFEWLSLSGVEFTTGSFARRTFDYASGVHDDTTGRQTANVMGTTVETSPPTFLGVRVHRFGGLVWLQGTAEKSSGNIGLVGTLTPSMRPAARVSFHVAQGAGVTAQIDVLPNGEVRLVGGGSSREWVSLSGVRFYAAGAQDELALARQALIDFSLSLEDDDMHDRWDDAEGAWRDRTRAGTSVDALRTSINELVDFMPRGALVRAWTDGRDQWRADLASASSAADLARSIRLLFRYTKWSVLDDEWDDLAPSWRAELEGYMTQ